MKRESKMKGRYETTSGINKISRQTGGAFRHSRASDAAFKGIKRHSGTGKIFIGPSVEGSDKEYVKILSGEVDRRKPSFA